MIIKETSLGGLFLRGVFFTSVLVRCGESTNMCLDTTFIPKSNDIFSKEFHSSPNSSISARSLIEGANYDGYPFFRQTWSLPPLSPLQRFYTKVEPIDDENDEEADEG